MDKQDIAEQAYKNGYNAGIEKLAKRLKGMFPISEDIFRFSTPEQIQKAIDETAKETAVAEYQFSPEMPDSIAGVPVSDLLFIAKALGDNPCLIEQIKDGYSFGHAVGYNAGLALFEKKMHEAILRMSSESIRLERGDDFDFTKVKFEIPPYKPQDVDNARLYGVKITDTPQYIKAVNPSTDGDDKK